MKLNAELKIRGLNATSSKTASLVFSDTSSKSNTLLTTTRKTTVRSKVRVRKDSKLTPKTLPHTYPTKPCEINEGSITELIAHWPLKKASTCLTKTQSSLTANCPCKPTNSDIAPNKINVNQSGKFNGNFAILCIITLEL